MVRDPRHTTTVTEAIENWVNQLAVVSRGIGAHAEETVSYLTRTRHPTDPAFSATVHLSNVAGLAIAAMRGSAAMWATATDNLALIRANVPMHWKSNSRTRVSPGPAWQLELMTITMRDGTPLPIDRASVAIDSHADDGTGAWPMRFHLEVAHHPFHAGVADTEFRFRSGAAVKPKFAMVFNIKLDADLYVP